MGHFGSSWFACPLGGDRPKLLTDSEVWGLLTSLLPPGDEQLYNYRDTEDDLFKFWDGLAIAWNELVFSSIDTLRQEATIYNAHQRIDDWANILGLNFGAASPDKSVAVRQTAVVSKLREFGACTKDNIQAAIGPLLGYVDNTTLVLVECSRALLKTLHTYTNSAGASIGSSSNATQTEYVPDGGNVSNAGAQIVVRLTSTNPEQLSFVLTSPTGSTKTWAAASLPVGSITSTDCYLYAPELANVQCQGNWSLRINTGAATCTLVQWSIFVEGITRGQSTGGAMFEWGVFADPTLVNSPDYVGAAAALLRLTQGHTKASLLLSITGGYPEVTSGAHESIPDTFLPA